MLHFCFFFSGGGAAFVGLEESSAPRAASGVPLPCPFPGYPMWIERIPGNVGEKGVLRNLESLG